jgi:hypothetical protein
MQENRLFVAAVLALLVVVISPRANAADVAGNFYGLLRMRDLSPFGSLRLDMRPAHAVSIEKGTLALEFELGYQNTWALSPQVERYLTQRESQPRRELGPDDLQAIRDLPGENYLVDLESAVIDVTVHYKFSDSTSAYLIASAIQYGGGFLDSTIEGFHDSFGYSSFGRPAVSRNDFNLIYDLKGAQGAFFDTPTEGGLADPTLGVRYTGPTFAGRWRLGLEAAAKLPVAGRRFLLSTGRTDYGAQASLQAHGERHAFYSSLAAVYYAGASQPAFQESQVIPTAILGYEYRWSDRTNINLQGYYSLSAYTDRTTDLEELNGDKYQLTVGVRHLRGSFLYSFGVTENLQNINNTPDIGFQFGVAFIPRLLRSR